MVLSVVESKALNKIMEIVGLNIVDVQYELLFICLNTSEMIFLFLFQKVFFVF